MATAMAYDVEEFLGTCVDKYVELAKAKAPLRAYSTPILPEDRSLSVAGVAGAGPVTECPWCHLTDAPEALVTYTLVAEMSKSPKALPARAGAEPQ